MKTLQDLKVERASLKEKQQALVNKARNEKRQMTDDENTQFDAHQTEIVRLNAEVERAQIIEDNEKATSLSDGVRIDGTGLGKSERREKQQMLERFSLHKALRSQLPGGVLDGVEAEYHQEALREAKNFGGTIEGVAIPNSMRAAGQTVGEDSGDFGGKLVYEEFKGVIDALTPKPIIESLGARYVRGLKGPASFVKNKGGIIATWEGEISEVNSSKNQYKRVAMDAKRVSATVPISVQNLHQSVIDLEMFTAEEIGRAVERAIDLAAINGPGTGNVPLGILNSPDVNILSAGVNGSSPSWSHLVDMETKVGDANYYDNDLKYLFNTKTKGSLKQSLHTTGDAKYLITNNECNGYGYGVSNFLPSDLTKGTGTNLSAAILGSFKELLIGEWGFSDMVVDNITGKKAGIIEITVNQYLDILLRSPEAFSVVKDWVIS
ncbi:hypothetical protein BTO06_01060 [Tenacibaculum sp. SZ-18]|uniref:phage major capsid protein n=1 Tax=Tenacibaculum sp. SZ-18 TaxID=754423 RepID=UPI000C2D2D72|nr:phage major capsid protein [Tenacibaculum sp. SZ-18]AUC13823.1 hypothetical protein BTO06_01060 [Tenacibaculum sp. SZ-18]